MIAVTVKGIADIGRLIGAEGEEDFILSSGATLGDLLDLLAEAFGRTFTERIYQGGSKELRKDLRFLLNGRDITFLNGLETELRDGDRLTIITPLAGG